MNSTATLRSMQFPFPPFHSLSDFSKPTPLASVWTGRAATLGPRAPPGPCLEARGRRRGPCPGPPSPSSPPRCPAMFPRPRARHLRHLLGDLAGDDAHRALPRERGADARRRARRRGERPRGPCRPTERAPQRVHHPSREHLDAPLGHGGADALCGRG